MFLTIMDTIHDYTDISRVDNDEIDKSTLRSRVLQTLNRKFLEAVLSEQQLLGFNNY
jgi:hypothetical protein